MLVAATAWALNPGQRGPESWTELARCDSCPWEFQYFRLMPGEGGVIEGSGALGRIAGRSDDRIRLIVSDGPIGEGRMIHSNFLRYARAENLAYYDGLYIKNSETSTYAVRITVLYRPD